MDSTPDGKQAMIVGFGIAFGSFCGLFILLCVCWRICCGKLCCDGSHKGEPQDVTSVLTKIRKKGKVEPDPEANRPSIATIASIVNSKPNTATTTTTTSSENTKTHKKNEFPRF